MAFMEWKPGSDFARADSADRWPGAGSMTADRTARHGHICLECALPLKTSRQDHVPECCCPPAEEVADSGWHFGDVEVVMLIWVGIVFMIMSGLAWF